MPLPYAADLVGRLDDHVLPSRLLRDNPLGDPADRPLQVYVPPGYDDEPDRRYPSVYVLQGYTGMLPMWHNRAPFRPTFPEAVDQLFADRRSAAVPRRLRRRVDGLRRQPVRRLPRHRPLPLLPLRRGRAVRRLPLPHAGRPGAPRRDGQVERRLRRHDHADAAAGRLRRPGEPRGRLALRGVLHRGVRQGRPRAARLLRRLLRELLGGLPLPPGHVQARRRQPRDQSTAAPRPSPRTTTAPFGSRSTCTRAG